MPAAEPIAVIGMGCRFPQAPGIDSFWSFLVNNGDAVTLVPRDRFDVEEHYDPVSGTPGKTVSRHGGFLDDAFAFDAGFFGIAPTEAQSMDPQQRLLLQTAWEALEDAHLPPSSLAGSRSGVFVGQATSEYGDLPRPLTRRSLHGAVGHRIRAVTAGRLSYALDLRGPSVVVDTACSSSLVAVHAARQSLLTGESDLAIAAGTNIILSPDDAVAYAQAGMLSADGRCKFADASGDGFVRSEGIGVVVLKRLRDALRDGDTVQALLLGSAVSNDGRASGLLLRPAVEGQRAMLREACRSAGITPSDLDYVEAHGTGTVVGDEVELRALAEEMGGRGSKAPLLTGAVKTNIGHTEAAAGIAALIKTVLIARHGLVPASLHYHEPHRLLAAGDLPVEVAAHNRPLPRAGKAALLGVSSFGLSGTNAHVVVGEYVPSSQEPAPEAHGEDSATPNAPHLLVLSARSPRALSRLARAYAAHLEPGGAGREHPLEAICSTAACRRDSHPYRLWAVGETHDELAGALRALAAGEETPQGGRGREPVRDGFKTAFVFPGQGSQWLGMGRGLLASWPEFRSAMEKCDAAVRAETGLSPLEVLTGEGAGLPQSVETVQPVLWAMEVALAEAWRSRGVEPDVCVGHSMGESAAAHVAGALSLRDAAAVICRRSRLMTSRSGRGGMLAVDLPADEARAVAERHGDRVGVAVENAPSSTVLAGDAQVLRAVAAQLRSRQVFCRPVKVDVASHSPEMESLGGDLTAALADLTPRPCAVDMVSTVTCRHVAGPELDAAYWMDNLRRPVRFAGTLTALAGTGEHVFLEISPHPVLTPAVEETLASVGAPVKVVASLHRDRCEPTTMARAAGRLFVEGARIDWHRWFRGAAARVPLPTYQWDAEHHREDIAAVTHPGAEPETRTVEVGDWGGVTLGDVTPLPAAAFLLAGLGAPAVAGRSRILEDVRFGSELVEAADTTHLRASWSLPAADGSRATTVEASSLRGGRSTRVPVMSARLRTRSLPAPGAASDRLDAALARCGRYVSPSAFLHLAAARGYRVPDHRLAVRGMWCGEGESVARMSRPDAPAPVVWEAALQPLLICATDNATARSSDVPCIPTALAEARMDTELPEEFWCLTRCRPLDEGQREADVLVCHPDSRVIAEFRGITLRPAAHGSGRQGSPPSVRADRLEAWLDQPAPADGALDADSLFRHVAAVLGVPYDRVDRRRPLRDLGLDSILAVRLRRLLIDRYGVDVPMDRLLGEEGLAGFTRELAASTPLTAEEADASPKDTGVQSCILV
ncbi:type I polyketide synthase [Streptomyces sp. NPDC001135]